MPLILDDHMAAPADMQVDLGVDDLFGDGGMNLQTRPSKRLLQRINELRSRGSCQALAWSKTGTIASIAPDGRSLELRYIRAHPKDASWGLSEATTFVPDGDLSGGPIVHLSWAPTQTSDLAIIDTVGRVSVVNFPTNVNRPATLRKWDADSTDDLNAVVGTYWLNTLPTHRNQKANPLHAPAVKEGNGNGYNYETALHVSNAPFHPNPSRSALFCVTTNGALKMFWTQNNNKIMETSLELESIASSDDLVTHAAMASDTRSKCMWVVLATSSKQLQLVQISLAWGLTAQENMKGPIAATQPLNPSLRGKQVAVSSWLPGNATDSPLDPLMTQISCLEFLPAAYDPANKAWLWPVILTVRSFVPTPDTPYNQEAQSIIDRWEVTTDQPQALHPAFENLGSRRNSVGGAPSPALRLKRLDPLIVNKVVIGIGLVRLNTAVCFTYSDGTVEYRERTTLNMLWTDTSLDRINSIHEAGFTHSGESSCLQTAVSPTLCSLVQVSEDNSVKWHSLTYTLADLGSASDAQYHAAVAALTISIGQAAASNNNVDDVLAVARQFVGKTRFPADLLTEMVRMMRVQVDYSEEAHHDSLVRNQLLQLCLSTLNHLGWNGEFQARGFRSKMAMFALNLRNIVILIAIANSVPANMKHMTPLDEPEVVDALAGCCRWSINLLCWIVDSLFCLLNDQKFQELLAPAKFSEMTPYLLAKNDIALHMILSSPTRGLLSAVCRRMQHLHTISLKAINYWETRDTSSTNAPPPALQAAYQKMLRNTSSPLINVSKFDELLSTVGKNIKQQYTEQFAQFGIRALEAAKKTNPNPPKNIAEEAVKRAQMHCELTMLLGDRPPGPLLPVLKKFFETDLPQFRADCKPSELFFANYDLLEVDDEPKILATRRQRASKVDLFKRVEISRGRKITNTTGDPVVVDWRRCIRCASVMEDVAAFASAKPGIMFVLSQQRNCCCGGRLAILEKDKLVG
ncbi:putative Mediator of RNA polymerase II transcription subunit 16 [Seiridium cardinale]|uniref:Mediator of RNA polymerase II transcription subunit 16 n=1 Tax=Seiridium cardinale TaxID=138064 RepID=A0ABR2XT65_9PEZI